MKHAKQLSAAGSESGALINSTGTALQSVARNARTMISHTMIYFIYNYSHVLTGHAKRLVRPRFIFSFVSFVYGFYD